MKKAKVLRRLEEIEASLSDLGLIAAKLEISEADEAGLGFSGKLPTLSDYREFMTLHAMLHQTFLRFGAR